MKLNTKKGFTLVETLITLTIIGVVAAMTLPSVIQNQQEKAIVAKVKKNYSILSQAYQTILSENDAPAYWLDTSKSQAENSTIVAKKFFPYLKVIKDCGIGRSCSGAVVRDINGSPKTAATTGWHNLMLSDGTEVSFYINAGYLRGTTSAIGVVSVNVNPRGRNILGKDVFYFVLAEQRLIPQGQVAENGSNVDNSCIQAIIKHTANTGGSCTAWVIHNENMDYLHCPEKLSWNGKHSCKE